MVSYGIETIDMEKVVVNPQYRKLTPQLKKFREKKQRVEANIDGETIFSGCKKI